MSMPPIRLLDLGTVSPLRSQTVYHAVAYAMTPETPDTILLVSPAQPYVCLGFHQDVGKEVDLTYCQAHGLPVYRREVGGGAVYLDNGQLFVQWIFRRGRLPRAVEEQFALYIRPVVETYQSLGINAYHRPINDIHVDGKKIGGTGAAQIGQAEVVVGSLMFSFDKAAMARVLKVSSEKMRDKIFESLEQYMTTLTEQLNPRPSQEMVKALYLEKCAAALQADLMPGEWTAAEEAMAAELDERFASAEWLYQKGGLRQVGVKIHEDVRVVEAAFKAPGGLIRVTARLRAGRIDDLALSGDFTLLPASAVRVLEQALGGLSVTHDTLLARLQEVYRSLGIQSPGLTPEHFTEAILAAAAS
jgi:lipoate-protein ligase A